MCTNNIDIIIKCRILVQNFTKYKMVILLSTKNELKIFHLLIHEFLKVCRLFSQTFTSVLYISSCFYLFKNVDEGNYINYYVIFMT